MDISDLATMWTAARAHAGLAETDIDVYPYPDPPPDGVPTAAFYAPGDVVMGKEARPLTLAQQEHANDRLDRPRILVHIGPEEAVVAAKLRHELEHVAQWLSVDNGRQLFAVYDTVLDAFEHFVGEDRRGSAVLYNIIPFEADANAAAHDFVTQTYPVATIDRLADGEHGVLFRPAPWRADVTTVAQRAVCAAALAAERTETHLGGSKAAAELFGAVTGEPGLWARLRARPDCGISDAALTRLIPGPAEIDAVAPNVALAWRRLRDALVDGINTCSGALG